MRHIANIDRAGPDSMKSAPAKARIVGAEHEPPTATIVRSLQATPTRSRDERVNLCVAVRFRALDYPRDLIHC